MPAEAVAMVGFTEVGTGVAPRVVGACDDVDHATDGVGAINRRRAILQHLDACDQRQRNRGKIDGTIHGGYPAPAVHQYQRAIRAKAAKVHAQLASTAAVDVAVQRLAVGDDQRLQHFGHALEARAFDLLSVQHHQRMLGFDVDAADVATRHDDRLQRLWRGPLRHRVPVTCRGSGGQCRRSLHGLASSARGNNPDQGSP